MLYCMFALNVHRAALCMVPVDGNAILPKPRRTAFLGGLVTVSDHAAPASVPAALTAVSTNEVPGAACVLSSAMPLWRSWLSLYTGSSCAYGHSAAISASLWPV